MIRALSRVVAVAVVVAAVFSASFAAAAVAAPSSRTVIVVLASGLSWGDIDATATPTLWKLAGTGAIGNLNAHPKSSESHQPPSALEGALDISAGNWVLPEFAAEPAYDASETIAGSPVSQVYARSVGGAMGGDAIAYVGLPPAVRTTTVSDNAMVLGSLGQAIRDAGGSTAAVGNSDAGDEPDTIKLMRPAAAAAMDERGLVMFGDVSKSLLETDAASPFGVRTNVSAFEGALTSALAQAGARGGPALIVLDPGDAYRAERHAWQVDDVLADTQRTAARRTLDRVVALALAKAGSSGTVIVAGEAPLVNQTTGVQGFSPVLVSAPGLAGYLTSPTTHRSGMVANPDINATVLSLLGIERPVESIGNPFAADPDPSGAAARIHHLSRVNASVSSIDAIRGPYIDALVRSFVALLAAVAAFLVFGRRLPRIWQRRVRVALMAVSLALVCSITAGWAMFVVRPTVATPRGATYLLWLTTAALLGGTGLVHRLARGHERLAPAVLLLGTSALLAIDQFAGGPLSVGTLIGYSPLQASRYYGIGNEAGGFMVAAGMIGSALLVADFAEKPWATAYRRFGLPLYGLVLVVAAAAPMFGANVGIAVWGVAAILSTWAGLNGKRLTWQLVLLGFAIIVLLVGGFYLLDRFGGGVQTHLARSVSSAQQGGVSQLFEIVQRKAAGNMRILFGAGWWFMAFGAGMAFLVFERIWGARKGRSLLADNPEFAVVVVAVLVAGVVAFFSEDTGVLIVTVMSLPLSATAAWLALTSHDAPGALE